MSVFSAHAQHNSRVSLCSPKWSSDRWGLIALFAKGRSFELFGEGRAAPVVLGDKVVGREDVSMKLEESTLWNTSVQFLSVCSALSIALLFDSHCTNNNKQRFNAFLRGMKAEDERYIEVLAPDLPCFAGTQLAINIKLRRALTSAGEAHPDVAVVGGAVLRQARQEKERTCRASSSWPSRLEGDGARRASNS